MKTRSKYAIFYCDQCELLSEVIKIMLQMYPKIEVKTTSDVSALLDEVAQKMPEYILIYMTIHRESFISVLKSIRETASAEHIPVVIYQVPPDKTGLQKLSARLT
jgi:DNA-binding NarL/FixJ family response regulator